MLLIGMFAATPALAEEAAPTPEELAQTLGITDTDEAVILVTAATALDSLTVAGRAVVLAPTDEGVWQIVRDQAEGLVPVSVSRGDVAWSGTVRALAGRVVPFDADEALASPDARSLAAADAEFDLFAFYDELDARGSDVVRLAYCRGVLEQTLTDADRTVVTETCDRLQASIDAAAARPEEESSEDLAEELLADDDAVIVDDAPDPDLSLLYRRDGRPRLVAKGTVPRVVAIGATAFGSGIATYAAFFWEYRAEQEYVLYRAAERVGDDAAMTRHLFFTQQYSGRRDGSIGAAAACLTGTAFAIAWQAAEAKRFRTRRAALEASAP